MSSIIDDAVEHQRQVAGTRLEPEGFLNFLEVRRAKSNCQSSFERCAWTLTAAGAQVIRVLSYPQSRR